MPTFPAKYLLQPRHIRNQTTKPRLPSQSLCNDSHSLSRSTLVNHDISLQTPSVEQIPCSSGVPHDFFTNKSFKPPLFVTLFQAWNERVIDQNGRSFQAELKWKKNIDTVNSRELTSPNEVHKSLYTGSVLTKPKIHNDRIKKGPTNGSDTGLREAINRRNSSLSYGTRLIRKDSHHSSGGEEVSLTAPSTTKGIYRDQKRDPGITNVRNNRSILVQWTMQNVVPSQRPHFLSNIFDLEDPNAFSSLMNLFNILMKLLEAENRRTWYLEASGRLWIKQCERFKL